MALIYQFIDLTGKNNYIISILYNIDSYRLENIDVPIRLGRCPSG